MIPPACQTSLPKETAMPEIVTLSFANRTSQSASTTMRVEPDATVAIARWYGAFCAGDDYDVMIDGEIVEKDINGEIG